MAVSARINPEHWRLHAMTDSDSTTKAVYLTAFIVALLLLGWTLELWTHAVSFIGPILPLRIRLVKKIDLQQDAALERRERRRRLELDAASGRVQS
jgi:hypothetical protein